MTQKQVVKAFNLVVPKKSNLPILENIHLDGNRMNATNLEISISAPFQSDQCVVPAQRFLKIYERDAALKVSTGDVVEKITIKTSENETIRLTGETPNDYPVFVQSGEIRLGTLTEVDLEKLVTACKFVSTNERKPEMCAIHLSTEIVATCGHCCYREKSSIEDWKKYALIPPSVVKVLNCFEGEWQVFHKDIEWKPSKKGNLREDYPYLEGWLIFANSDNVTVSARLVEENYPNLASVYPEEYTSKVVVDKKELQRAVERAKEYSNSATHQVRLSINGSFVVSSEDIDFGGEYSKELPSTHLGEDLEIGFNADYLLKVLVECGEAVQIQTVNPTKASLWNDRFLIMPMRLNA